MTEPRILCVSFSPIHIDSRVRRQLTVLREFGTVTTVGYGPQPPEADHHVEVPAGAASLPQTPLGVARLALRHHSAVELNAPGERAALPQLAGSGPFDLVVANDARALPLAFAAGGGAPVWTDLHEWAPQENSSSLPWRILVGPYMDALCRKYLKKVAATTTVNGAIASLYEERYGVLPEVIRNAIPDQHLSPSPVDPERIRLVHGGVAAPERNIEGLIDAVSQLDDRFSLDLFLVGDEQGHLGAIRRLAANVPRVRLHSPIPPADIPSALNAFDLGVYILPTLSLNHRLMLPNKFFEFVQARLGLVFGPSVETDRLITEHGLGVITRGSNARDLVDALRDLSAADVTRFKAAAHLAAATLSNETDLATQRALVGRLLKSA